MALATTMPVEGLGGAAPAAKSTKFAKTEPLWRQHDLKSQKVGQRGTIYWVGKSILGEDGTATGGRAQGASYHGEWHGDKKNGYGIQMYPNGNKYEGQWENGLRSGEGVLWVRIGESNKLRKLYVGSWKDDRRHGKGTCYLKSGEYFQGCWEHGKMHGNGQMRYACGDLYLGEWHNGLRSGQGTLNRANGDCYEGYWLNDQKEGSGSYFYAASGKVFVGEWSAGLPKSGVYTQAHPNPEQATQVPKTTTLPNVKLAHPVDVLEGALAAVREARKGHRAKHTPVGRLFADEELDKLREAFDQEAGADGLAGVTMEGAQVLCANLGLEVPTARIEKVCVDCGIAAEARIGFEEFARVVAVLLDEEAMEPSTSMDVPAGMDDSLLEGWVEDPEDEDVALDGY